MPDSQTPAAPPHVYLINVDAMPWGDDLASLARTHGFQKVLTFNQGTYTTTSQLARLTGRISSDLVPGGVAKRTYVFHRYYGLGGPSNNSLFRLLPERGWDVTIHNDLYQSYRYYLAPERPPAPVEKGGEAVWVEWLQGAAPGVSFTDPTRSAGWRPDEAPEDFLARDGEVIRSLQAPSSTPTLTASNVDFFHSAAYYPGHGLGLEEARELTLRWLDLWSWTDPQGVYVLYADHGYRCSQMCPPPDHMTWTLVRDNRTAKPWAPCVAGADVHAFVRRIADPTFESALPDARNPTLEADRDRVYLLDDARESESPYRSVVAAASMVTSWSSEGLPEEVTQVSWHAPSARLAVFRTGTQDP